MEFFYTKHQVVRGAKADAEVGEKIYLIKNCSCLRLTYQIKMLAYMAKIRKKTFIINIPKVAKIHDDLREFVIASKDFVKIERS